MPRAKRAPKRAYHHGDLRRALLDAAIAILSREGPHALTLREVAERVGVSQAAPYHHFASKEAILAAVAEEGFEELDAAMVRARDRAEATPFARLGALGRGYVDFAVRHPAHFRVMFVNLVDKGQYPSLAATADRAFTTLLDAVVASQEAGTARGGDPRELAILCWAAVHGLAMLWIDGACNNPSGTSATIESLVDATTEMLTRGLAPAR